ncbi:helix-turn-helix domain-containing protein [Lachnoclostridium sp. Marseille-P6806]|uniref:helix-turn-helix domain-containing protein n=1 Tax=Lachnoclostridium sp. Marseille-P6806 TaxID=2364793 RepID=UPI001031FBF0|nr:AraC family transcriptional regulator [Lachnoclostridium sp. Marseille-P6806]
MSNGKAAPAVQFRSYDLNDDFPVLLLTGDIWHISDVPSHHLHFHNCVEIGICESDNGMMKFGDEQLPFQAGDVTVVGCDIPHTTWSAQGTQSKWSYIFADLDALLQPYPSLVPTADEIGTPPLLHDYYAIFRRDRFPDVHTLMSLMVSSLQEKKNNCRSIFGGLIISFLNIICNLRREQESQKKETAPDSASTASSVIPALKYIRLHFQEDFPLEALSSECHMSSTSFRRTFTQIMAKSPLRHLTEYRIQHAMFLLRSSRLSVLEISEESGFQSISSFNRNFIALTGLTPREYRKKKSLLKSKSVMKYSGWIVPEDPSRIP